MMHAPPLAPATFSSSKPPPGSKASGLATAVSAVVGAVTGEEGWNGTVNGKSGFQKGNRYGAREHRSHGVEGARSRRTAALAAVRKHTKARTLQTPEGRAALKASARASRDLQAAKAEHHAGKLAQRREKAAEARVERATDRGRAFHANKAHGRLAEVKEAHGAGALDAAAAHLAIDRIARDTHKGELFDAATRLGLDHASKTKAELVAKLRAHLTDRRAKVPDPETARDPSSHTDHEPGHVGYLQTDLIRHDAQRFQYKLGASETGSVGSLKGVRRYDQNLGGILSVWKDPADGKVYVVNGHNRLDLANKLGADRVTVRFLNAKDANEARSIGALQNISEGRGNALDAAKFFRDTGLTARHLDDHGIPVGEKVGADGLALSKLDGKLFRRVIDGDLTTERGVIIGGSGLSDAQQRSLADLIDKKGRKRGEAITNAQLRELVDDVAAAPKVTTTTKGLFGDDEEEESLALQKAKVSAHIKGKLATEKRLFGTVSRSRNAADLERGGNQIDATRSGEIAQEAADALAVFDTHKKLAGPVSRALNEASERLHAGENPSKVQADAYRKVLAAVRETLG